MISHQSYEFVRSNEVLFACRHILQRNLSFVHLVLTYEGNKRNTLGIGIAHLLLHLDGIREVGRQ